MKRIISVLLTVLTILIVTGVQGFPVFAETQRVSIMIDTNKSNNFYPKNVSLNEIAIKSGGKVTRDEIKKTSNFYISGKNIKVVDNVDFAEVDGKLIPLGATYANYAYIFRTLITKNDEVYVPVEFIAENIGLKLNLSDGYAEFEDSAMINPTPIGEKNNVATNKVWTVTLSKEISNDEKIEIQVLKGEDIVPVTTKINMNKVTITPNKDYEYNTRYLIKMSINNEKKYTMAFTTGNIPMIVKSPSIINQKGTTDIFIVKNPVPVKNPLTGQLPSIDTFFPGDKMYTGENLKQKLYTLGFVNMFDTGKLVLNNHQLVDGFNNYTYMEYKVLTGKYDMSLFIANSYQSNEDINKLTDILDIISASSGGGSWIYKAYLDKLKEFEKLQNGEITSITPNIVTVGRRTFTVEAEKYGIRFNIEPLVQPGYAK